MRLNSHWKGSDVTEWYTRVHLGSNVLLQPARTQSARATSQPEFATDTGGFEIAGVYATCTTRSKHCYAGFDLMGFAGHKRQKERVRHMLLFLLAPSRIQSARNRGHIFMRRCMPQAATDQVS